MFQLWLDFWFGGPAVRREDLGNRPEGEYSDRFKPPAYDHASEIAQGVGNLYDKED